MNAGEKRDLVFREAFEGLHEEHKTWKGLIALVKRMQEIEVNSVASSIGTPDTRAYNAGRLAFAMEFENQLRAHRAKANPG